MMLSPRSLPIWILLGFLLWPQLSVAVPHPTQELVALAAATANPTPTEATPTKATSAPKTTQPPTPTAVQLATTAPKATTAAPKATTAAPKATTAAPKATSSKVASTAVTSSKSSTASHATTASKPTPTATASQPSIFCPDIADSIVTYPKTPAGETASGTCAPSTSGNPTRLCQKNGTWAEENGSCRKLSLLLSGWEVLSPPIYYYYF